MATNYVLKNKGRRLATRVLLIALVACFLLPWYRVEAPGNTGVTMSGYNLLVGEKYNRIEIDGKHLSDNDVAMITGLMELAGEKRSMLVYPSVVVILAFLLVAVSIACTFVSGRGGCIAASILTFVSFLMMLVASTLSMEKLDQVSQALQWMVVSARVTTSFFVMMGAYILSVLSGIIAAIGKYKPEQTGEIQA